MPREVEILVVDDDLDMGETIVAAIEHFGYRAAYMQDSGAAREALRAEPGRWRLLITDYDMPNVNGRDLIQVAKAAETRIPCLLVTAGIITADEASAFGADRLVKKPFPLSELRNAVQQLAGESEV